MEGENSTLLNGEGGEGVTNADNQVNTEVNKDTVPVVEGEDKGGGEATNVLVGLSKELLSNERLKDVKSVEDLANRLVSAKLAPEIPAPDGYKLPEGTPPEIGQFAHENNLTQEQLDGVMGKVNEWYAGREQLALKDLADQGQAKLVEWGEAAKDNLGLANSGVSYIETKHPGLRGMLVDTGYGNHPLLMDIFKTIGEMVKEGSFVGGDTNTPATKKMTAAEKMYPSATKE
jgi:hypothetical protein